MSHIKPVCVHCRIAFKPYKNGVYVIEMAYNPPQPYRIWSADIWQCPKCRHLIVKGFSDVPKHHFDSDFDKVLAVAKANEYTVIEYEE